MYKEDPSKPWFDQPKTKATWYRLKPPYDNVVVGCDPGDGMTKADADQFDAIVNVSSTRCETFAPSRPDQRTYWYPIIEMGRWSLGYLLWLKEVMDFHHNKGHKIYLHCHAGAFRSPSAACLWLESRGHSKEEALALGSIRGSDSLLYTIQERQGNIPKRKDQLFKIFQTEEKRLEEQGYGTLCVERLLTYQMNDPWDHETMSGKYRTANLIHHYFWFYFKPKYWLRSKWTDFKYWAFERRGWHREGYGTYMYERKHFWAWPNGAEAKEPSITMSGFTWDPVKKWIAKPK